MSTNEFILLLEQLNAVLYTKEYDYTRRWDHYTRRCVAITLNSNQNIFSVALALGRLTKQNIPEPLIDDTGTGLILYWPEFPCES